MQPPDVALEVVTLLPGFSTLQKRSGELDGNLPVRAARYCGPVFEGNTAGFQVSLAQPMTVARTRSGAIECVMTEPTLQQVTQQVDEALERGIAQGLLARGGYWHRLFKGNALPSRGHRLLVWTGHMVRPRRGLWALVGGAFNRRSRVEVADHLVTDADAFVPLVIEIDTRAVTRTPIWLEGELGCVTPLSPQGRVRKQRMEPGAPELRQFAGFFSEAYFETKTKHPTASYVVHQRKHRVKADQSCDARLLYVGPDIHTVGELSRFITPEGFARRARSAGVCQFGLVRNLGPVRWTWQGQTHTTFEVDIERHRAALHKLWRETFGEAHPSALEFLNAHLIGQNWDQPYVQFQPWAFMPTAPGWSTLVDGVHHPGYDGMRAVIATDWFYALAMVYRIYGPSKVTIPYRAPMLRALPISRAALAMNIAISNG
jgi:hypothetical protein